MARFQRKVVLLAEQSVLQEELRVASRHSLLITPGGTMRKTMSLFSVVILLVIIFAYSMSCFCYAQNSATKSGLKEARSGLGVAVVNGYIYAIGGATSNGFCSFNEEYNITTDSWNFKAPMPTARSAFGVAVFQNKIYCLGGYYLSSSHQGSATGANEVYDPATDIWQTRTPMPTPELNIRANVVDGKIYVIGGNNNGTLNQVYDPATDSWTTKAPMPFAVSSYASAVAEDKIYVFTNNLTQIYSPENDTWSLGKSAPSPLILANAGATTGTFAPQRIYVFSVDAQLPYWQLSTKGFITQCYDPKTDNWTACNPLQTGRYDVGIAVVHDLLYVIGGFNTQFSNSPDLNPIYAFSHVNELYTTLGYGTVPQTTAIISPENVEPKANSTVTFALIGLSTSALLVGIGMLVYLKVNKVAKSLRRV